MIVVVVVVDGVSDVVVIVGEDVDSFNLQF